MDVADDHDDYNNDNNNEKAANQGTTENSHIVHCTHTSNSTNMPDETFNMEGNIACVINCNYCRTTTLCTLETWFVLRT